MPNTKKLSRRLQAEARKLAKDRERQEIAWNKRQRSFEKAIAQGPRPLPDNWFTEISFKQRQQDRYSAVWDALVVKLHRHVDPLNDYASFLDAQIIRARKLSYKEGTIDDPTEEMVRRLKSTILFQSEEISILEKRVANIGDIYFKALEERIEGEITSLQENYNSWYEALGRPSFTEKFDDLKSWAKSQKDTPSPNEKRGILSRIFSNIQEFIGTFSLPILVPIEIIYVEPAFEFLSPNHAQFAYASAAVFTGLLVLTGWGFASFATRARISKPNRDTPTSPWKIRSKCQPISLAAAVSFLFLGGLIAISGADLRSKLPAIRNWDAQEAKIALKKITLRQDIDFGQSSADDTKQRSTDLEAQEKEQKRQYDEILRRDFSFPNSDGWAALAIYLGIFAAAACKRILARDPWLEYEIVSSALRELGALRFFIATQRELERRIYLDQITSKQTDLAKVRAELRAFAPDDPEALRPDEAPADASLSEPEEVGELDESPSPSLPEVIDAWKHDRLRRYAHAYLIFRKRSLEIYSANIKAILKG